MKGECARKWALWNHNMRHGIHVNGGNMLPFSTIGSTATLQSGSAKMLDRYDVKCKDLIFAW